MYKRQGYHLSDSADEYCRQSECRWCIIQSSGTGLSLIHIYVADIYKDGEIIEIQTRQFNRMRGKLQAFLPLYPVTIVYPIPVSYTHLR